MTTRGRCLFAGGCAAIVCAILLDERDLLRAGILAAALPLLAILLTARRRPRVTARHQAVPDLLRPGSIGSVHLTLTNAGWRRTRPMEVTDAAVAGLTDGARCVVPPLRPGASAVVRHPLLATRRGRFTIGSVTARVTDPFGLWSSERIIPSRTDVLVLPATVPLLGMPGSLGSRSAAAGAAMSGISVGEPDTRVRHYTSGDDIRTIHWRASARRDELLVRMREPVSHGGATVLLDHRAIAHRGSGTASSLETAVTLAASIAVHVLGGDYQLRLVSHTGALIAEGNDVQDDVLVGLADVTADTSDAINPVAVQAHGVIIAVGGALDADAAHLLVASRPRGSRGVALLIDAPEFDAAPTAGSSSPSRQSIDVPVGVPVDVSVDVSADILRAGGWRVRIIHPGDDLAAAWREASGSEQYTVARSAP